MRLYKYLIIDDDDMDRLAIGFYLKAYTFLEHKASFSSSRDALDYIENNEIDILFLDIDIPGINGIELLKLINEKLMCAIFITSHPEFAVDGFDLNAFDYIIKPLSRERFDKCIFRLKEYIEIKTKAELFEHSFDKDSIMVKEGYNYVGIRLLEVTHLEALKDYTKIFLLDRKNNTVHGNLSSILNNKHFKDFLRVHKSFAVQKKYIKSIKKNEITLINGCTVPIGQYYKKELLKLLT